MVWASPRISARAAFSFLPTRRLRPELKSNSRSACPPRSLWAKACRCAAGAAFCAWFGPPLLLKIHPHPPAPKRKLEWPFALMATNTCPRQPNRHPALRESRLYTHGTKKTSLRPILRLAQSWASPSAVRFAIFLSWLLHSKHRLPDPPPFSKDGRKRDPPGTMGSCRWPNSDLFNPGCLRLQCHVIRERSAFSGFILRCALPRASHHGAFVF